MKIINRTGSALQFLVTQSGSLNDGKGATIVYTSGVGANAAVEFDPKNTGDGPVVFVRSAEIGDMFYIRRKVANKDSTVSLTFTEE